MSRLKELRKSILLGVFINLTLIFILPVWLTDYFISITGPVSNYFAEILNERILQNGNFYSTYYEVVSVNYTGSFSIFLQFLKGNLISESLFDKIISSLWIVSFLFISRNIILSINSKADYRPFLIFPFVFSYPFISGDWNFLFSILSVLWAIRILIFIQKSKIQPIRFFLEFLLCLFFAGISGLPALLSIIAISTVFILLNPSKNLKFQFGIPFLSACVLSLVPFVLLNDFLFNSLEFAKVDLPSRFRDLLYFKVLYSFSDEENMILVIISLLYGILFLFSLISIFYRLKPDKTQRFWHQLLYFSSLVFLLLFFILPDANYNLVSSASHWLLLSAIFLLLSLACLRIKKAWILTIAILSLIVSIAHLRIQYLNWNSFSQKAISINKAKEFIPENSVLLITQSNGASTDFLAFCLSRQKSKLIIQYLNRDICKEYELLSGNQILERNRVQSSADFLISLNSKTQDNELRNSLNLELKEILQFEDVDGRLYQIKKPAIN
ncbi:MAG: hypothetical protein WED33_12420 [Bacteroidia bacterium]